MMTSGYMFFDGSNKSLDEKILEAAGICFKRHGVNPDTCFVNPVMLDAPVSVPGIMVKPDKAILPNNFYLGATIERANGG